MRQVFTEINIQAPVARVWEILTDLESYRKWNPFIVESHGKVALGERLTCRPRIGKNKVATFHPRVSRLVPERVFAWTGHTCVRGVADGVHIFELTSIKGSVRLVHRQEFSGLLMPLIWKRVEKTATRGFNRMNEALKIQAEQGLGT